MTHRLVTIRKMPLKVTVCYLHKDEQAQGAFSNNPVKNRNNCQSEKCKGPFFQS